MKGRFDSNQHPVAVKFSSSLEVDRRLYREDIEGSLAHLAMLERQGIVKAADARTIRKALRQIREEIDSGKVSFMKMRSRGHRRFAADDVHMAIESRLIEKIGGVGGKLHTARSRNDQIALDERLYIRGMIDGITKSIRELQRACVTQAERNESVVMPGYTHLQRGQPILLAHHLLAYVSMLERDADRFSDCRRRVNRSPLGAGALAGTSFPIDRSHVARQLGMDGIILHSMDAVSDRDVQIEFLAACAVTMMHMSRFAEEVVLWSSAEWAFAEISDAFATGSSMMPQKKNPDVAELVRGKCGRVYADLMGLLTVMKGLPLAYNRDMQEDKTFLFDAADTVMESLSAFSLMLESITFRGNRFEGELNTNDSSSATNLADYLVRQGTPFRTAHAIVGSIVRECLAEGIALREMPLKKYRQYSKQFDADLYGELGARNSIRRMRSVGSTSSAEVRKALRRWKHVLGARRRKS